MQANDNFEHEFERFNSCEEIQVQEYEEQSVQAKVNGKPIPFVVVTDSEELEISSEAMTLLDQMQRKKIAVIAVTGPFNTGKSFLSNQIVGHMKGFGVRVPMGSGTRGIWMWDQLMPLSDDTEGILLTAKV